MNNPIKLILILPLFLTCGFSLQAQTGQPQANAEDVSSLDGIIEALYGVISGDSGEARDWNRFLSLFKPGAQLTPSGPDKESLVNANYLSPQEYVDRSGPWLEKNGFFEKEISRKEHHFGSLTHIWSTYESRYKKDDPAPFSRGINSIQLLNDGQRWWIINIYWTAESTDNPIPEKYLTD